ILVFKRITRRPTRERSIPECGPSFDLCPCAARRRRSAVALPIGLIVCSIAFAFGDIAVARDRGQFRKVDPAMRKWVEELKDKKGKSCCDTADGYPAEYEWDMAGNGYRVRIEGEWYAVPVDALIDGPNKLGYATVWYWWSWDFEGKKTHHIRCF